MPAYYIANPQIHDEADLSGTLDRLQGERFGGDGSAAPPVGDDRVVDVFGGSGTDGSLSVDALTAELDQVLRQADQDALALRTEIGTAARALGRASDGSAISSALNAGAVAAHILAATPQSVASNHTDLAAQSAFRLLGR